MLQLYKLVLKRVVLFRELRKERRNSVEQRMINLCLAVTIASISSADR